MSRLSDYIEDFIRMRPGAREEDVFRMFLQEDRVAAWTGSDASRVERLRREFATTWARVYPQAQAKAQVTVQVQQQQARPAPRAPVAPMSAPAPAPAPAAAAGAGKRKLQLLCAQCEHMDVWLDDVGIMCHHCGKEYDDLLALIPVRPIGPLQFAFGEGAGGWLTAGGVALLIAALYVALRWL